VLGIERQHRVQQQAMAVTLGDLAKTPPATLVRVQRDLAAVLQRQNVAPGAPAVRSPQCATSSSTVTAGLARNRPKRTIWERRFCAI
jgi:hypothetical protein